MRHPRSAAHHLGVRAPRPAPTTGLHGPPVPDGAPDDSPGTQRGGGRSWWGPRWSGRPLLAAGAAAALVLGACAGDDGADPAPPADEQPGDPADDGLDTDAGVTDPGATDDGPTDDGTAGDTDGAATDDGTVDDGATDGEAAGPEGAAPLTVEASTEDQEQPQSSGARLTLTDVRVGTHDGFDRVTLEVAGDGAVGWFTRLDAEARNHGKGDLVELDGAHALTVALRGMELPPERDDDVAAFADDTERVAAPDDASALTEVAVGGVFEGQKQVFLGLTEEVPVRVARFESPERLVIDLVHP